MTSDNYKRIKVIINFSPTIARTLYNISKIAATPQLIASGPKFVEITMVYISIGLRPFYYIKYERTVTP